MGECGAISEEGVVELAETTWASVPLVGSSYCTYSPDTTCYQSGWPSCCEEDSDSADACPEERPPCELDISTPPIVGGSYCTYSPNTACYQSGWPSCCGVDNATCPEEQPPCEVTDGEKILNSAAGQTAASAASVLSTSSFIIAVVAVTVVFTFMI